MEQQRQQQQQHSVLVPKSHGRGHQPVAVLSLVRLLARVGVSASTLVPGDAGPADVAVRTGGGGRPAGQRAGDGGSGQGQDAAVVHQHLHPVPGGQQPPGGRL